MLESAVGRLRAQIGDSVFRRVAGPDGAAARDQIHGAAGERWFDDDRPIRQVHGDASMFIGGLRALLLQSLHPLAMSAVAAHSGYKGDPWGRLQRTSRFLAVTTFGTAPDAQEMVDRIRAVHARVVGVAADGRPYAASDPHLLGWVHVAEVDSFLRAYVRYGAGELDADGRDAYVADAARVAIALGVTDPPTTERELAERLDAYRPELAGTREAREAARFVLLRAPVPVAARAPYGLLAAAAVAMLPRWARWPLRLPYLPVAEATVVRVAGEQVVRGIRWAMPAPPIRS
ncbi:MAG: DUF2236 domain-containing protein [Actinomycetota bacterium]|nr:DUF2236 domain-containing protein [Actinomycetota bacterium]